MTAGIVAADHLSKWYGQVIGLNDVSVVVPPGITGLWQVSGRSELSFDECVRLDLFYIENWSLTYDLFILAKTLPALLSRRGAY